MVEDIGKICKLLIPVLREINGFRNVLDVEYRSDRGLVYIIFATGVQMVVYAGKNGAETVKNIIGGDIF